MTIYISHPYGGKEENKEHVETIIKQLVWEHPNHLFISPIHALGFLYRDVEYKVGLNWCLELLDMCDEMWVFGDYLESKGCVEEIKHCLDTKKSFQIKQP